MSKSNNATNTSLVYKATSAALAGVLSVSMVPILAIANEGPADATATNTESTGQNGLADEATADYITLALSTTYKDGTYTGASTCTNGGKDDWGTNSYQVSVSVTVEGGAISKIEVLDATYSSAGAENETYIDLAADGSKKKQGTITQIVLMQLAAPHTLQTQLLLLLTTLWPRRAAQQQARQVMTKMPKVTKLIHLKMAQLALQLMILRSNMLCINQRHQALNLLNMQAKLIGMHLQLGQVKSAPQQSMQMCLCLQTRFTRQWA
jgi:uncharacterized protein with FMN-binding domain